MFRGISDASVNFTDILKFQSIRLKFNYLPTPQKYNHISKYYLNHFLDVIAKRGYQSQTPGSKTHPDL